MGVKAFWVIFINLFNLEYMNNIKKIPVPGGRFTIFDAEDYKLVSPYIWTWNGTYVVRNVRSRDEFGKIHVTSVRMHREIMSAPKGYVVDHINGNPLDNRKCNLRIATIAENSRNRNASKSNKSGYKGVYFNTGKGKFDAAITFERKKIFLGRFSCPKEAARVYNEACVKYFGEFAKPNEI